MRTAIATGMAAILLAALCVAGYAADEADTTYTGRQRSPPQGKAVARDTQRTSGPVVRDITASARKTVPADARATRASRSGCIYKGVMSDAEIARCL